MFENYSFEEWQVKVKSAFGAKGLTIPDDIELLELAHMECRADNLSIEEFVRKTEEEQS